MQFICESCKAHLTVADEKIRGKRLIVRCKRCGVQIRIVDPALLPSQSTGKAVGSGPQSAGRPEAGPIRASQSGGRPSTGPIARVSTPRRETDTESTRAMDSEVLEKALRASKAEDAAPRASAVPARRTEPPPPPPRETPAPRDPAVWFAMVHGKQLGPITRAELGLKASAGQVGPRTYLWKEGMESWIRAKDVPELVPLFAAPPTPPPPPGDEARQREPRIELPFDTSSPHATPPSTERARNGADQAEESASPDAPTPPGGLRLPAGDEPGSTAQPDAPAVETAAADDPPPGTDSPPDALDLARWGAAELSKPRAETPAPHAKALPAAGHSLAFGAGEPERRGPLRTMLVVVALAALGAVLAFALLSGRKEAAPETAPQGGSSPAAVPAPPPEAKEGRPEEKPAGSAPQESAGAPALSAEQLLRKVDESKPALQGCVDEALKRDPSLHVGKILISTTIAPSGAVTSARIDQKAVDQSPLGVCLKTATRKLQFPPFSGEAFAVDIPIVVTGAP
jgi:predicted Zn finger-like uncharacterized protein